MIVGVTGFPRSGKDTVADYLVAKYGFVKLAINEPMRAMLSALNPFLFQGLRVEDALNSHGYEQTKNLFPEYRKLLQRLGKEASRDIFGENFWIDMAIRRAGRYQNVVFNDVRFANEASEIRRVGLMIKVVREGTEPKEVHASDVGVPDDKVNYVILNDGSLEDLYDKINGCLPHYLTNSEIVVE
jgi:hypothetical protein